MMRRFLIPLLKEQGHLSRAVGYKHSASSETERHFTVNVIFAKYSVRLPRCSIVSRLPQAMM